MQIVVVKCRMPCAGCCALYLGFFFHCSPCRAVCFVRFRQGYFYPPHIVHQEAIKNFPHIGARKGYTAMQSKAANQPLTIENRPGPFANGRLAAGKPGTGAAC